MKRLAGLFFSLAAESAWAGKPFTAWVPQWSQVNRAALARALSPTLVAVPLAGAIGMASWGSSLAALALAPLAVSLWATRTTRLAAWLIMLAYYLAAARGLPFGAARFFGNDTPAIFSALLWFGASLALSAPWACLWSRQGYYWRVPLALLLCTVPPVGLVGWANPVVAAGVFFPSLGWFGLATMVAALAALCYWPARVGVVLAVVALAGTSVNAPAAPEWIQAHQTTYGGSGGAGRDFMRDYAANQSMIELAVNSKAPFVLFPETVAGLWTPATAELWADAAEHLRSTGRTAIVGAEVPIEGTGRTRNALVFIGHQSGELVQRIPVPVSMWKPWADAGTEADLFGDGIGQVNAKRAAVLVCYEQLLVWSMLLSQAARPEIVIGAANDYWAAQTSIPGIQTMTLRAWSRLFSLPLVVAVNL